MLEFEEVYRLIENGEIGTVRKLLADFVPQTIGDYIDIRVALAVIELPLGKVIL